MIFLYALALGILSAFSEIFPFGGIQAHLIVIEKLFKLHFSPELQFAAQSGVLAAILLFYVRDVRQMLLESPALLKFPSAKNKYVFFSDAQHALTLSLVLVSFMASLVVRYMLLESGVMFSRSLILVGVFFALSGFLILMSRKMPAGGRNAYEMNHQDSFFVGLVQGGSVFIGLSRTGLTTLMGMKMGVEREEAARFSYLLAIPYLLLSVFLKLRGGLDFYKVNQPALLIAFLAATLSGMLLLAAVRKIICSGRYFLLGFYSILTGTLLASYFTLKYFVL